MTRSLDMTFCSSVFVTDTLIPFSFFFFQVIWLDRMVDTIWDSGVK